MIVLTIYGIIVFHLTEWMRLAEKSLTKVLIGYGLNMLAFSFLAIPTRHEVSDMPVFGDINSIYRRLNN